MCDLEGLLQISILTLSPNNGSYLAQAIDNMGTQHGRVWSPSSSLPGVPASAGTCG